MNMTEHLDAGGQRGQRVNITLSTENPAGTIQKKE